MRKFIVKLLVFVLIIGNFDLAECSAALKVKPTGRYAGITYTVSSILKNQKSSIKVNKTKNKNVVVKSTAQDDFKEYDMYCAVNCLNVRDRASKNSDIVDHLYLNDKVTVLSESNGWCMIQSNKWVVKKYLSNSPKEYLTVIAPPTSGKKSFEYCTAIKSGKQFKLRNSYYQYDDEGFCRVNNRYCIAVGTAVSNNVGTLLDLKLKNGTIIPCIVADIKDDYDTMSNNIVTRYNGCASEFVVTHSLRKDLKSDGSVSKRIPEWDSPVDEFHVYDINVLE